MSEFRQDPVSEDWIIVAPERAKRPDDFLPPRKKRPSTPKSACPFEDLKKSGNWPPLFLVPNDPRRWRVAAIPNKYPALVHGKSCFVPVADGPYVRASGIGYHDLIVTRDHRRNLADMSRKEAGELFAALVRRFHMADKDNCMAYVSVFYNWGSAAGASLYHPHYQVLTLPVIPADVEASLSGSAAYFKKHRRCVHCDILAYERKGKKRVIEENAGAIAFTPFVPKSRMEVSVYPKRHFPFFERTPESVLADAAALVGSMLRRVRKYLRDPDLNFFIHTGPIRDQRKYGHYHWHIDVIPKIYPPPGGFELSTGVDINAYDPDWLAAYLRGKGHRTRNT